MTIKQARKTFGRMDAQLEACLRQQNKLSTKVDRLLLKQLAYLQKVKAEVRSNEN